MKRNFAVSALKASLVVMGAMVAIFCGTRPVAAQSRKVYPNPLWGAPRIHGELLKLGIEISQSYSCEVHGAKTRCAFPDLAQLLAQSGRRHPLQSICSLWRPLRFSCST